MAITSTPAESIRLGSSEDLLAAAPYLLGYHPADSMAFLGLTSGAVTVSGRYDLSTPECEGDPAPIVATLLRHGVDSALLIGYGPPERVTADMDRLRGALAAADVPVREALRVTGGRYWSYLCGDVGCCPCDGTPFDLSTARVAAAMTFAGLQTYPTREELAATIASDHTDAVRDATGRALGRFTALIHGDPGDWDRWRDEGLALLHRTVTAARDDDALPGDEDIAALSVLLTHDRVRDEAWALVDEHGPHTQLRLWSLVTRRADPDFAVVPALLLAFAAWRLGNGALARIAVERALTLAPEHRLALMLAQVLDRGDSPVSLPPVTREWIASYYEEETRAEPE
ncbi:hypothetical protein Afil01_52940 [Actinorhabdospora filicis]|uniref:DUF4192 domain-containing protein n=1 Tax=Actinorhabdospora filicis TaxID=1785913 RepID=A0A9W6SQT6_9ACTN|nr:DUF4192 domain-containing protein [Actinorhabdospora filicis]GLZ80487.1 hypothetical protein Afil01_52940 [Actinorhabdospora filicis]